MMPIRAEDIEYLRPESGASLLARYYRPEGAGPFPAVLEVHGGAWTSGDRPNNIAIREYLAAHGIVVLSIDFRMPPAVRYPGTVADGRRCQSGIRRCLLAGGRSAGPLSRGARTLQ
jgi:acetyl esterase